MKNNIDLELNGFNLVYAVRCGTPKNIYFDDRLSVTRFLMDELNNIDFLSINDIIINKEELVNNNIKLSRYIKLMKLNDL